MIWTAILGKQLLCECEIGNVMDQYAVAAKILVVYPFLFGKSQYDNKGSQGYAIYHIAGLHRAL